MPFTATSDEQFDQIIEQVRLAISQGILPQRASKGSSGTYFVRNTVGEIVGVFKPKDEEVYGANNPNWCKFLQKCLFPCLFGRSCLVKNSGYLCEAAASYIDTQLELGVVPTTKTVALAAPNFCYGRCKKNQQAPYPKIGSFQLFVGEHFREAAFFASSSNGGTASSSSASKQSFSSSVSIFSQERRTVEDDAFLVQFQKFAILDFLIRNTDRGMHNWLISPVELKIAAIDNGLSFPHHHPDKYRSYPYSWASLPIAKLPFCGQIRSGLTPRLTNMRNWETWETGLKEIFFSDPEYDVSLFEHQMALFRGQILNVCAVLQTPDASPSILAKKPNLIVRKNVIVGGGAGSKSKTKTKAKIRIKLKRMIVKARPCFSCC